MLRASTPALRIPMPPIQSSPPQADLSRVRSELLVTTYRVVMVVGGLLTAANVARYLETGWNPLYGIYFGVYAFAVAVYLNLQRLPFGLVVGLLVGLLVASPIAGFWVWGIAGNTLPVLLAACMLASMLIGTRGGMAVLAVSVGAMAGVAVLMHTGRHSYAYDVALYMSSSTAWSAAILTFAAMAALIATQLSYLRDRLCDRILAARESRRALAARVEARRQTESALRLSRARFRLALDAAPDAIVLCDLESDRIIDANPAFGRLTGTTREAAVGRANAGLEGWLDAEAMQRLRGALAVDGRVTDQPARIPGADKKGCELLVSAARVEREQRKVLLLVARDVSAQVRTAANLRAILDDLERRVGERSRQLEAARRDLEGFVNAISHDLRAPLRAILGSEHELRVALGSQEVPELDRVRQAARETSELIDALQELSRINRREVRLEDMDLSALAIRIVTELRASSPQREFEARVAPGLRARADPVLLRVVLANLLANALKFTSHAAQPLIEVGATCDNGLTAFFVRDNGVGFDMAYAAKLFEPFERLHAPSEFEGTGIGLAIVARAVRHHGGRIWAESGPAGGATFWFTLVADGRQPPAMLLREETP